MTLRQSIGRLGTLAKRLRGANDGLSAVEFALLLPVMLIFYLGGVESRRRCRPIAWSIYRQYRHEPRHPVHDDQQERADAGYPERGNPSDVSGQVQRSQLRDERQGRRVADLDRQERQCHGRLSQTLNGTARSVGSAISVPTSIDIPNTNVVLGETTYAFNAAIDFLNLGTFNLSSSLYMVPRASTTINLTS